MRLLLERLYFCGVCVTFDAGVVVITWVMALNGYDEVVEDCRRVDGDMALGVVCVTFEGVLMITAVVAFNCIKDCAIVAGEVTFCGDCCNI